VLTSRPPPHERKAYKFQTLYFCMKFLLHSFSEEEKFAFLFGIMLGDGCLSEYVTKEGRRRFAVCITGDYYSDKALYKSVLSPLLKSLGRKSVSIKERPKNGTLELNFPDKNLLEKIQKVGFPVGKKGTDISIPKYFFDKGLVVFVIKGFFATDGSLVLTKNPNKFYPRLEGHGISKNLISQIKDYLVNFGLEGAFYKCKRKKKDLRWKTAHQQYRFQFNGKKNLLLFEKIIGFMNPKHKKRFDSFMRYSQDYDSCMKNVPTQKQKLLRKGLNKKFEKIMATPRVELGTSCS
jgi:hypothetical protein